MNRVTTLRSRLCALGTTIALTTTILAVGAVTATSANADISRVAAPSATTTVTADALPTVQIDGVVWQQAVLGNTVYAAGKFATARPAGAAAGTGTTIRNNMMAYDITTGNLVTTFAPDLNAQALAVAVSPDGSRVYVGGDFTVANGANRYRIAAYNTATGALISTFAPVMGYRVNSIVATNSTVYVGGDFKTANGVARGSLAAFNASNGALLGWNPNADAVVNAMTLSPDGTKIIVGGRFQNVGGSAQYGMAALDLDLGGALPWNTTNVIRNAGTQAAIYSLRADGNQIYGTGYVFGAGGNFEGTFAADPATGNINWLEDCHGDTYDAFPVNGVVYTVSHAHYCSTIGGFFQSDPWATNQRHALAFTSTPAGTVAHNQIGGYADFFGQPSPALINWFPDFYTGTFTGQGQAAWSVTGNSQYIVMGGEFPGVNGTSQQGLVRFAVKPKAPSKQGPRLSGANFVPSVASLTTGTVRVAFQANWDRDNKTLNYRVVRNGDTAHPVYSVTADSTYWERSNLGFIDTGLTPGATYTYRVYADDSTDAAVPSAGNVATGNPVSVTVADSGAISSYAKMVKDQGAGTYWRLSETSGAVAFDWVGFNDGVVGSTVGRGAAGIDGSDSNTAATFDGTATSVVSAPTAVAGPNTFTTEAWIKTTSTTGGKIIGFGNSQAGTSGSYDRHTYMDNSGRIWFGAYPGGVRTINSTKSYNDGNWHQVVSTMGPAGMTLYVDGLRVATRSDVTTGQAYDGFWRVGGDNIGGWTSQPTSNFIAGTIDEVSIYPTALSKDQILAQYVASGRTSPVPAAPADAYGAAVYNDQPDLFWRLGEADGTVAADASASMNNGTYVAGYTQGAAGALPNVANTAVTFNGTNGLVASNATFTNPSTYSEEAWFKTTSAGGGKIIGFGDKNTGNSTSYDRHVYMLNGGKVAFGVYTGQTNIITSTQSYNNGQWHHVVATQAADGMKLYLDGQLVATNPQSQAQAYTGYWRVGGDTSWSGNNYFAGQIDEVAIYPTALTADSVVRHFQAGGGQLPNVNPSAALTSTQTFLKVDVDGSGSTDADGTIASYAWNFGDGSTGTGATASHTYLTAGTYQVQLTVTDNRGGTGTATKSVTVAAAPPNTPPTAAFSVTTTNLKLQVDGAGSTDTDGTVTGYAWDFGDGATGTGVTASHVYATGGTYQVKLTVTDNQGATNALTTAVTVAPAPPNKAPTAAFTSNVTDLAADFDAGGSSDTDGTIASYSWTFGDGATGTGRLASRSYAAAGVYHVVLTVTDDNGATGQVAHDITVTAPVPPNVPPTAAFTSAATNLKVHVDASTSTDSDGTVSTYAWDFGDGATGTGSVLDHTYAAAGTYAVKLTVTDNKGAQDSVTSNVTVAPAPPANVAPVAAFTSTTANLKVNVNGSTSSDSDGSVASYHWDFGDGGTATGATAAHTYAAGGTYQVSLTVTDNGGATNTVTHPVTTAAAPNVPPTAAFTSTTTNLKVDVDGRVSADSDGSIATYAWDFGDGATGSGSVASHTYGAAGTYQVKLTVTDNQGAVTSVTNPVTVSPAPPTVFASDQFTRAVASGWGTADQGGAWTLAGGAANFSADGSAGKVVMATAGAGPTAYLNGVSARDIDAQLDFSLDKAATGGGNYVYLATRKVGNSAYQLQARVASTGAVTLTILKVVNNVETAVKSQVISGLTVAPNDVLRMRLQASGTGTTTLTGKIWKANVTEPTAWQVSGSDSESTLQVAGAVGLKAYLSGTATNSPVSVKVDNLTVRSIG